MFLDKILLNKTLENPKEKSNLNATKPIPLEISLLLVYLHQKKKCEKKTNCGICLHSDPINIEPGKTRGHSTGDVNTSLGIFTANK